MWKSRSRNYIHFFVLPIKVVNNFYPSKKTLTTIGNKWSTLQAVTYASSSQPYYVLYSPKNGLLTNPIGYTPDISEFESWLKCGLEEFNK